LNGDNHIFSGGDPLSEDQPVEVTVKEEATCIIHKSTPLVEEKNSRFAKYFRNIFSVKACPKCGYMALFRNQQLVRVGGTQAAVVEQFK